MNTKTEDAALKPTRTAPAESAPAVPAPVAAAVAVAAPENPSTVTLGATVCVLAAAGHLLRTPDTLGYFSETDAVSVTVDTRIYRLIRDGELLVAAPRT
jgi:hypothetical protein